MTFHPLLLPHEPPPLEVDHPDAAGPVLLVCEHAGRRIPAALGDLGLAPGEHARHFMWDIGALDLARALSARLDAPLLRQRYSRMVCDCNRPTDAPDLIPEAGEGVPVPGNASIDAADREARIAAIWRPFHDGISGRLDARRPGALVSVHSYTPHFHGLARPWQAGVLFARRTGFVSALLDHLRTDLGEGLGENQPYTIDRASDWTIPVHGEDRGLPCALLEVRNDLLATPAGVAAWADRLAGAVRAGMNAPGREAAA